MKTFQSVSALALAAIPFTVAQTFSDCDPTKKTDCPTKPGLNQAEYYADFTKGESATADWTVTSNAIDYQPDGGKFSIKALGEGPTMQSNFHIFGGYVEVVMKAAPGAGVVSSIVLQSDTLDEMDWEMIGSDKAQVQSNYFGKGNTTTYDRGQYHPVDNPQDNWVTYAVNWTMESTTWFMNGQPVRTLNFADAVGGQNYPQTPCNIRLGNWVAGTPGNSEGTIQWAGGLTDMSQAPFDMWVKSVKIVNYSPANSYKYGDQSGSWQSVQSLQDPPQQGKPMSGGGGDKGPGAVPFESQPAESAIAASSAAEGAAGGKPTITITTGGANGGQGAAVTGNCTGKAEGAGGMGTTYSIGLGGAVPTGSSGSVGYGNSTNGGLVGAGTPSNGTNPTYTISPGGISGPEETGKPGEGASGGESSGEEGSSGGNEGAQPAQSTLRTTGSQASFGLGATGTGNGPLQATTNAAPIAGVERIAFGGLLGAAALMFL